MGLIVIRIAAYADLPDEAKLRPREQRVCHECPDGPCPQECLETEHPVEGCKRGDCRRSDE
jgi:hypothetical protein